MSNKQMKPIKRPRSLCDIAVENIRNAIIQGSYELGEALSEAMLVNSLGISKTPIREALSILKQEGLVSVIPQKGTFVFTLSAGEVAQLGHYRFALESTAIDMAMARDAEKLVSDLRKICDRMKKTRDKGQMDEYLEMDGSFHDAIFTHCGNEYLTEGYKFVKGKVAALRTHLSHHPTHTDKSYLEHFDITELLAEGKIDEAKLLLQRHVTRGERSYTDTVNDIAEADKKAGLRGKPVSR